VGLGLLRVGATCSGAMQKRSTKLLHQHFVCAFCCCLSGRLVSLLASVCVSICVSRECASVGLTLCYHLCTYLLCALFRLILTGPCQKLPKYLTKQKYSPPSVGETASTYLFIFFSALFLSSAGAIFEQGTDDVQSAFKYAMLNHNLNVSSRRFELQAYVDVINTADAFKLSRLSMCFYRSSPTNSPIHPSKPAREKKETITQYMVPH